jgi:hypothetical protein
MPSPSKDHQPVASHSRRFQFSLRTLFVVSFLFAIVCAGIFNSYNIVRYVALLAVQAFLFYVYLTWWIYGRGYLRTFGIGATLSFLFPWAATGILWIFLPFSLVDSNAFQNLAGEIVGTKFIEDGLAFLWPSILALILLVDSLFTGGTMVLARWLIDRCRRKEDLTAMPIGSTPHVDCGAMDAVAEMR